MRTMCGHRGQWMADKGALHGARFSLSSILTLDEGWFLGCLFCCLGGCCGVAVVCPEPVSIAYGQGKEASHRKGDYHHLCGPVLCPISSRVPWV